MDEDPKHILKMVLYAVGMAMGIVSIVLNVLGEPVDLILLAIGLFVLGLAGITSLEEKNAEK